MRRNKRGFPKGKKLSEIRRSAVGERIFSTRKSRRLSQTELGNLVGLSQRMISHYEGDPPEAPPLSTMKNIAEALNVTVGYLLGESALKGIKDETMPGFKRHFKTLRSLPPKDRRKVIEYADLLDKAHGRVDGNVKP